MSVTMSKRINAQSGSSAPLIHPISGGADHWASPAAVLEMIGRATGHLSAKRRPSDAARRAAVAVAAALTEIIRDIDAPFGTELWTVEVPHDPAELCRRSGASSTELEEAIALLQDTGCLVRISAGGNRHLRLSAELFAEHPTLARIHWETARSLLDRVGGSRMPALAVLREVAVWSGGRGQGEVGPWVEVSLSRLMDSTLFRRTAVSRALAELERAGLIGRALRAGREHAGQLLPAAFGSADPAEAVSTPPPSSSREPVLTAVSAPSAGAVAGANSPTVTLRFGESEIRIHGGMVCEVRSGADGVPILEIRSSVRT